MSARHDYDVIVVGTGPAGLALANLLAHYQVRTLVLEKDPGLSAQPKALNADDEFFRLLEALGLGQAMRGHAKFPISYRYVSPLGLELGFVQGRFTEHNAPNRAAIFQPEFEKILCDHAAASGWVQFAFDQEVVALQDEGDGVHVVTRSAEGHATQWRAGFLVGADGAHSACRKLLDIPLEEVDPFDVRHVVVDVLDDEDASAMALTRMGWRRNFFSMPAPNGRRFEFSLRDGETAEWILRDETLRALFKPWRDYDRLHVIRKVVHTFRSRIAARMGQGRVFLVGDAAHLMPVFGSQGMNSGARDANNLAWKLAQVIHHGAPAELLATYHEERWDAVRKTIRMATLNGRVQKVQSPPLSLLRDLFFGLLRLVPPAQRWIRDMKYIPKPFLRSSLTLAGQESGRGEDYVGRLHPNPGVTGGVTLDAVLGTGFAVVGVHPSAPLPPSLAAAAREWNARIVAVHPAGAAAGGAGGQATAVNVEDERYAPLFSSYADQWLLVRPDRIVAAAGPAASLARALAMLRPRVFGAGTVQAQRLAA